MISYRAICDVPTDTLRFVTARLVAHRRRVGTRRGRRAASPRTQALLMLRYFRDDASLRVLAMEAGVAICTAYRYLHEAIDVIAAHAPDLHEVLERARREQWSHVKLDGTLIRIDRVDARKTNGHHLWYSGKHKSQGANLQVITDPGGFPVWCSPVEPGSVHDLTAARVHCLPALYAAASQGLPTLADKGYHGAGIGIRTPFKGRNLAAGNATYNNVQTSLRASGERANTELKDRWRCLRRIRVCPQRITNITRVALVLSTLQRGH